MLGILKNRSIWCNHITSFNDPQELQYEKEIVDTSINEAISNDENINIKNVLSEISKQIGFYNDLFQTYIACFCKTDNLLS